MTEPADPAEPISPAPVPVLSLQYERHDPAHPRAVRGISWLAAALLLMAAQLALWALLDQFGAFRQGRAFYYTWVAVWLATRLVDLTACWIILPGRTSEAALAGAIVRWGMAVGLLAQFSPFALRAARVLPAILPPLWWTWASVVAQFVWFAGIVWAILIIHRSLNRAGIPSQLRAFLVVLCIAIDVIWEALGVDRILHFFRPPVNSSDAVGFRQAERVLSWCTCAAGVALVMALIAARRRLRHVLRRPIGL